MISVEVPNDLERFIGLPQVSDRVHCIEQSKVDAFCRLVSDLQWVHFSGNANGQLGHPIVPGNYLVSRLPSLFEEVHSVRSFSKCILAGYDDLRFRQSLAVGSTIRFEAVIVSVRSGKGFTLVKTSFEVRETEANARVLTGTANDVYYS